jgi:histidyl-tRNA synthetase
MADRLQAPKGVPEYTPPRSAAFVAVREALAEPIRRAGYGYLELPMFEDLALYVRGVGESTDVVSKEMYTFDDRGGRSLALRPEGTAGVVRSVIENSLDQGTLPVKLWYAGAFFRAERPQKGRYRQLQQVGAEAIGSDDPVLDAEVIAIADEGFRALGLRDYTLDVTSLGDAACRPGYRDVLLAFLDGLDLDEPTRERARLNPLRVLDDKRPHVQEQLTDAPLMADHLCDACAEHYAQVRAFLGDLGVAFRENKRMVRGLDYYTRTTFEFVHHGLGAQSGIGGGGRYDGLMENLGGRPQPGIGFGLGVDRTLLACEAEGLDVGDPSQCDVYLVPIGAAAQRRLVVLGAELRRAGVRVDMAYDGRGLKGAMKAADRSGARFAVILGDNDIASGMVQVKHLHEGKQTAGPLDGVVDAVARAVHASSDLVSFSGEAL